MWLIRVFLMETIMDTAVRMTAGAVRASWRAWDRKGTFLALFLLVFAASMAGLDRLDLLPDPSPAEAAAVPAARPPAAAAPAGAPEDPVKIDIRSIGLSATIADPRTTDINALDALLLKGAVRYPTSAKLNENGNIVIFGHSSYLPVVNNSAYKTFDGIQRLKAGDVITVYSSDAAYAYAVRGVAKENANDAIIPLSVSGKVLTLSTCNSFATKDDRFVVTADFVESHPLGA